MLWFGFKKIKSESNYFVPPVLRRQLHVVLYKGAIDYVELLRRCGREREREMQLV